MILFVLRLEYSFKAMEMVLKKTLGYSLFEKRKSFSWVNTSSFINKLFTSDDYWSVPIDRNRRLLYRIESFSNRD